MSLLDALSVVLATAGAFFFIAGTAGLLRFPDTWSRLHAVAKADNLGLGFVMVAVLVQLDSPLQWARLGLIWGLVMVSGAAVSQLIGQHALAQHGDDDEPGR
jgi:multicomponent Na+:H+ antiporter subunit G